MSQNDDEVGMFNTVDVYFEDDDETETYKIVTTVRGNSLKNLISKESPLGPLYSSTRWVTGVR